MDFAKMRSDGFSDQDIIEGLRSDELFKDTADFDGLRAKGMNDTQIVDALSALPSFHEEVNKRKEGLLTPPTETSTTTVSPTPQEDSGFLSTIKKAGESLLKNLFDAKSTYESLDAMHQENKQKLANAEDGIAKDVASGLSSIGDGINYVKNDAIKDAVTGMDNAIDGIENPTLKSVAKGVSYMPVTPMGAARMVDALSMSDQERKIADVKASAENMSKASLLYENLFGNDATIKKDSFDKISQALMNTNLADKVELDEHNQLWIMKDGQEARVEDGFLKNVASMFQAYSGTIVGGTTGAIVAPLLATAGKVAPSPALKVGLSAAGAALGSVVGAGADQLSASAKTGLDIDPTHLWKKMTEEGLLSLAADGVVYGGVKAVQAAKPTLQGAKEFFTGDTRAYQQMLSDMRVDDAYTKQALDELNALLQTPLSDTKQSRMYAASLKHEKGLDSLQAALNRNADASNMFENEVVQRTNQILSLLEDNAVLPQTIIDYLERASELTSQEYKAMRAILRSELQDVPVTLNTKDIAETIASIGTKVHDPSVKSSFESLANFIKNNENYTNDIDGLLELRQDINGFFANRNVKTWVAPDNAKRAALIKAIDEAIYQTMDATGEQNAKALKEIFESVKDDYSAMKKSEASSFFKKIDTEGLDQGQRAGRLVKGMRADDESATKVLERLSPAERERLELTALNEVVQKEVVGRSGGVKAIDFEDVLKKLKEMNHNMTSKGAKETIDFFEKMKTFFAKDKELVAASHPIAKSENPLSTNVTGKAHIMLATRIIEWGQRKIPFSSNAARLDVYYRLGKYMETSHDTKSLLLKLYNDPLNSQADRVFFGKALSNLKSGGDDALGGFLDNNPLPPDGGNGGGGIMTPDEISALWESEAKTGSKTPTKEEIESKVRDIVANKHGIDPDEPTPPSGGGGSPKTKGNANLEESVRSARANPENQDIVRAFSGSHFGLDDAGQPMRKTIDHFEEWYGGGGVDWETGRHFDSHGIAKTDQLGNLLNLLENGIHPEKAFHTTHLVSEPKVGAPMGTAGGAYKDGAFIVLGGADSTIAQGGIKTVLVSDAVADTIPHLQKRFPNVEFVKYSEAQSVLGSKVGKTQADEALHVTPRHSKETLEKEMGKALEDLSEADGFYTHYSQHEFDTLSTTSAKEKGNLGQTKGKETNENHTIDVNFSYKDGARVENESSIGLAGQHEYKVDLRGKTFFDNDKKTYFFKKIGELKDADSSLDKATIIAKAQEALGYDDATVKSIIDFDAAYKARRATVKNETTKDTQNKVLEAMGYDGIEIDQHREFWGDAPVYKVRTLDKNIDYAGMKTTRADDGLDPVSKSGDVASVKATIEATPSTQDPLYKTLKAMPYDERIAYEEAHIPLVHALAKSHGLDADIVVSKGAYVHDGVMQNNPVLVVSLKPLPIQRKVFGELTTIKPEMELRDNGYGGLHVNNYEASIEAFLKDFGAGTNQDSVPWYAPVLNGDKKGAHSYFTINKELSQEEFEAISHKLMNEHGSLNPQVIDGQLRIMDFNGMPLEMKQDMIHDALEPFIKSGQIDAKRLEFDSIGKLLQQGQDYERLLLHDGNSQGGRPNLPKTTDSHNAGDAFAEGVAELRRKLQEPPSLDGGQKTVQDSLGSRAGSTGEVRPSTGLTPKEAGERIAQELKDAPNSQFKGGYIDRTALTFMAKSLSGGTAGSLTEYDYNQDGTIDYKDRAIGAAMGIVAFHALTSKPAFASYKAFAEHGIRKLEARAEAGDMVAQSVLGVRYAIAGEKGIGEVAPFVSRADELIQKMPNKMGVEEFFKYLRNNGVKEDEINFSGLEDLLDKKSVTKEDVKEAFNAPKLEKKVIGTPEESDVAAWWNDEGGANESVDFYELTPLRRKRALQRYMDEQIDEYATPKFDKYSTVIDGGQNYREVLTTIPKSIPDDLKVIKGDDGYWYAELYPHDGTNVILASNNSYFDAMSKAKQKLQTQFKSSHWDEPNVLYHIREQDVLHTRHTREEKELAWKKVDEARKALEDKYSTLEMKWDKTDPLYKTYRDAVDAAPKINDKEKMLLVEEIQSDWHQEGRKRGYKKTPEMTSDEAQKILDDYGVWINQNRKKTHDNNGHVLPEYKAKYDALIAQRNKMEEMERGVSQAPYAKTWHEKAMKDVIKEAVENGYDRVAWVAGKEQADRYSLAKQVKHVRWYDDVNLLKVEGLNGETLYREITKPENVGDIIGKEAADKLLKTDKKVAPYTNEIYRELEGDGLKVGGEGMKGFYDQILPSFTAKYIKKFDSSLEKVTLANGQSVWSFKVTPKMKEDISKKGQYLYSLLGLAGAGLATKNDDTKGKQ